MRLGPSSHDAPTAWTKPPRGPGGPSRGPPIGGPGTGGGEVAGPVPPRLVLMIVVVVLILTGFAYLAYQWLGF